LVVIASGMTLPIWDVPALDGNIIRYGARQSLWVWVMQGSHERDRLWYLLEGNSTRIAALVCVAAVVGLGAFFLCARRLRPEMAGDYEENSAAGTPKCQG
jgi:hypothetical protein